MAEKRKRSQNYGVEEKDKLVKLLALQKETLLNKKTDGATNEAKNKAWIDITNAFNSSSSLYRNKDSLMKLWDKMKTESKFYYQNIKRCTYKTGGGPSEIKIDPIMEQVCALLGRACTGILGVQDCDFITDSQPIGNEEPLPKTIIVENEAIPIIETCTIDNMHLLSQDDNNLAAEKENEKPDKENYKISKTPLWSRRRPQLSNTNERTEALSSLCSSYFNVNKKKEDIENLKNSLLLDEIMFKKKLYELQLQTAAKELEIKNTLLQAAAKELEIKSEVLSQIKGGALNLKNLFGVPQNDL